MSCLAGVADNEWLTDAAGWLVTGNQNSSSLFWHFARDTVGKLKIH
jgi:hypothetical protein